MSSRVSRASVAYILVLAAFAGCTVYDYGPSRPPVIVPGVPVAAPPHRSTRRHLRRPHPRSSGRR